MFYNRLEKNWKKLKGWADQSRFEAIRIYDRDIPEYPYIVDRYGSFVVVYDKTEDWKDADKPFLPEVIAAAKKLWNLTDDQLVIKQRDRQKGLQQYEKQSDSGRQFSVREGQAQYWVNLWDYLDTGLFLDHRPLRQQFIRQPVGPRFLNLFCYTSAVSVAAALGGATTINVDMSATYLEWGAKNFTLNRLTGSHLWLQEDATSWLHAPTEADFDCIFLDPPTFSNSKRMEGNFEVERDQDFIVTASMDLLKPGGVLYFSNNKRKFQLSDRLAEKYSVEDISKQSIPRDFHDQKIHRCFKIKALRKLRASQS